MSNSIRHREKIYILSNRIKHFRKLNAIGIKKVEVDTLREMRSNLNIGYIEMQMDLLF